MLLDAGEGVQTNIRKYKVPMQKIDLICISHMHGDHVLGLPGLLGSMNLFGRERPLCLTGPKALEPFVRQALEHTKTYLRFPLRFTACNPDHTATVEQWGDNTLTSVPVKHRIEAFGFKLQNRPTQRNLKKEEIVRNQLQRSEILKLKSGLDVLRPTGEKLNAADLCYALPATSTYVFSGDTAPCDALRVAAANADVLYHEATFLHELHSTARSTGHTTSKQAADTAVFTRVQTLILGHLSSRYKDESVVLAEAQETFAESHLAKEGMRIRMVPGEKPRIDYLE